MGAINPEAEVKVFNAGVTEENLHDFLDGVDVYIDGLDFFVLELRARLFRLARDKGITCITAAPIGMGAAYLIFTPDGMSFDEFFALGEEADSLDGAAAFLVGLTPAMLQRDYVADQAQVDLEGQRGPSTAAACQLCAGVAATEALKAVLGRGPIKPAPYYHQFDAYTGRFVSKKLLGGAASIAQQIKKKAALKLTGQFSQAAKPPEEDAGPSDTIIERVLDAGRWTPSADNTQPWRFVVLDDTTFRIKVRYDPNHIYEYADGQPTRLACGMLLETMRLRAANFGRRLTWRVEVDEPGALDIECALARDGAVRVDPLHSAIEFRQTDRGAYEKTLVDPKALGQLEAALGEAYQIEWHEGWREKLSHARLNAKAAIVRFKTNETIPIHRDVVKFKTPYPRWGMPSVALGMSGFAHGLMRFAFRSALRSKLLLKVFGGALYGAIEMDLLPGLKSGAHFTVFANAAPDDQSPRERTLAELDAGAALQRLWLASAKAGLGFQPSCAPICFGVYGRDGIAFSKSKARLRGAKRIYRRMKAVYGEHRSDTVIFRGRIGHLAKPSTGPRSLRMPLKDLIEAEQANVAEAIQSQAQPETEPV